MELEQRVKKLNEAIDKNKSKDYVDYRFREYMKDYDNLGDKNVIIKLKHRELFLKYSNYMIK